MNTEVLLNLQELGILVLDYRYSRCRCCTPSASAIHYRSCADWRRNDIFEFVGFSRHPGINPVRFSAAPAL